MVNITVETDRKLTDVEYKAVLADAEASRARRSAILTALSRPIDRKGNITKYTRVTYPVGSGHYYYSNADLDRVLKPVES